jgi:hypothetical protein
MIMHSLEGHETVVLLYDLVLTDHSTESGCQSSQAGGQGTKMYSTRRVNKNMVDGNAYTTVGDPYKGDKGTLPPR